jgi:hypothetical protein
MDIHLIETYKIHLTKEELKTLQNFIYTIKIEDLENEDLKRILKTILQE